MKKNAIYFCMLTLLFCQGAKALETTPDIYDSNPLCPYFGDGLCVEFINNDAYLDMLGCTCSNCPNWYGSACYMFNDTPNGNRCCFNESTAVGLGWHAGKQAKSGDIRGTTNLYRDIVIAVDDNNSNEMRIYLNNHDGNLPVQQTIYDYSCEWIDLGRVDQQHI